MVGWPTIRMGSGFREELRAWYYDFKLVLRDRPVAVVQRNTTCFERFKRPSSIIGTNIDTKGK